MKISKKALYNIFTILLFYYIGIAIYSNSLFASFQFDDELNIWKNPVIINFSGIKPLFLFWPTRFITYLTVAFNYNIGKLDVFGYHLFNILVHIGASLLVWQLLRLTFETFAMKDKEISKHSGIISILGGLIFLTHPLQTQAVTYIIQRATSLAAFFYLASLTLYVKSRLTEKRHSRTYYFLSLACAVLAMFSKEMAVTLPFAILLYEHCFLKQEKPPGARRISPFFFISLVIPLTMFITHSVDFIHMRKITEPIPNIPPWNYLITQFKVLVIYLRLLFIPLNQNLDYNYPIVLTIFQAPVLLSLLLLTLIIFFAFKIYKKYRLVSFGIFLWFLTLIPESSLLPIRDVIFEHRLYLPMSGFSIFLVFSVFYFFKDKDLKVAVAILLAAIVCFSVLTYRRNFVWRNELTLWEDTMRKSPHNPRAYKGKGFYFDKIGNYDQALDNYNKALELYPGYDEVYYNRGIVYGMKADYKKAIEDFSKAIDLNPKYAEAYCNRGLAYFYLGEFDKAIAEFDKAIEVRPNYALAYYSRGNIYLNNKQDIDKALADYNKSIQFKSDYADAYHNRGFIYFKQGDFDKAIADYNKAIQLNHSSADAYNNRGFAYYQKGDYQKAIPDFTKAIQINPKYSTAYHNRGISYGMAGEFSLAIEDLSKAISLNPLYSTAYHNRGLAFANKNDYDLAIADYNIAINIDPKYTLAYANRATAYFYKKEYKKTWFDVLKAQELGYKFEPDFLETLKKESSGKKEN